MATLHGRAPRGERLLAKSRTVTGRKTTGSIAGLRSTILTEPCVIDGPINANGFVASVEQVLVPTFTAGDIVVLDNLAHKMAFRELARHFRGITFPLPGYVMPE
jgi:hypothetical protein